MSMPQSELQDARTPRSNRVRARVLQLAFWRRATPLYLVPTPEPQGTRHAHATAAADTAAPPRRTAAPAERTDAPARPDAAGARAEAAGLRTKAARSRPDAARSRPDAARLGTKAAGSRADTAKSRADAAGSRADTTGSRVDTTGSRVDTTGSWADASEGGLPAATGGQASRVETPGGAQASRMARARAPADSAAGPGVGDDRGRVHDRRADLPALPRADGGDRAARGDARHDRLRAAKHPRRQLPHVDDGRRDERRARVRP